jgi:tripartite-type tricarboxylate transporter receptor subunit TctC
MNFTRRRFLPVLSIPLMATSEFAVAQNYPNKAVRLVVPYATGGSTDVVARFVAPRVSELLGTSIYIDNKPGGSSTIGVDAVAKAPPDGHTLGIINIGFVANPSMMKKVPYNTERDLLPVSLLAESSLVMVVHPSVKARSLKELIAQSKNSPRMFYASAGIGVGNHLITERLKSITGLAMDHVPYKGGGPSVLGVLSGDAQMVIASVASVISHIKAGKLVPLAVGGSRRHELLPEVPSFSEVVPGFEAVEWVGLVAPAGTPSPVVEKLHSAISKSLAQPELRALFASAGLTPVGSAPPEFAAFVKSETQAWSKVIRDVGITVD